MLLLTKSISTCAAVACLLVCAVGSLCGDEDARVDVKAVGGLRIRLQLPAAESARKVPPRAKWSLRTSGPAI